MIGGRRVSAMRKRYLVIKIIGAIFLLMAILFASCTDKEINDRISIKINLKSSLSAYKIGYAHSYDTESGSFHGINGDSLFIDNEISTFLSQFGIKKSYDEKNADLKVECQFRYGWGLPRIVRGLVYKYVTKVDIKLIDTSNQEVIGEVEYLRPWFKDNPTNSIQMTLKKLIESGPK